MFEEAYTFFNYRLFDDALPPCIITFQRQARLMGYVSFKRWVNTEGQTIDELAINPTYFANYHITTILQTLCHEMVHIWQEHYGNPSRPGYHNKEWSAKMKSIGLMPSTTGEPGGAVVGEAMSDYVIKGGGFEQTCNDLLSSGFKLRWYDTVPVPPPTIRRENKTQEKVIDFAQEVESRQLASLDIKDMYADFPINLAGLAKELDDQEKQTLSTTLRPNVQTSKVKNRSNRNKYVCPSCFIQVWGKPELNIKCGECDIRLYEEN